MIAFSEIENRFESLSGETFNYNDNQYKSDYFQD
jgi:hypothetical protein